MKELTSVECADGYPSHVYDKAVTDSPFLFFIFSGKFITHCALMTWVSSI
jgi:hypothetical protein